MPSGTGFPRCWGAMLEAGKNFMEQIQASVRAAHSRSPWFRCNGTVFTASTMYLSKSLRGFSDAELFSSPAIHKCIPLL
jgi:hypothetical protein